MNYLFFGLLRAAVFGFLLGCAVVVEGKLKPPGGAAKSGAELLEAPTDGRRLKEKLGVVFTLLAMKLKPLFEYCCV